MYRIGNGTIHCYQLLHNVLACHVLLNTPHFEFYKLSQIMTVNNLELVVVAVAQAIILAARQEENYEV